MNYTHLTQDERYQIYILLKAGHCQSAIAMLLNRHPSTISRELHRNHGQRGYRPKQAQGLAEARASNCRNARHITPETWQAAQARLREQHSPEQIAACLPISQETLTSAFMQTNAPAVTYGAICAARSNVGNATPVGNNAGGAFRIAAPSPSAPPLSKAAAASVTGKAIRSPASHRQLGGAQVRLLLAGPLSRTKPARPSAIPSSVCWNPSRPGSPP